MEYRALINVMENEGLPVPRPRPQFQIPQARMELVSALITISKTIGERLAWLPEYDQVAKWLGNTNGKGLFLYGNCGRGKSLLARYAIPMIYRRCLNRVFSVADCASPIANIDELLQRKFVVLDDIGRDTTFSTYGNRRDGVMEIISRAEAERDMLLVITSNFGQKELIEKYGDRTVDRIKYLCERIPFNGKSYR